MDEINLQSEDSRFVTLGLEKVEAERDLFLAQKKQVEIEIRNSELSYKSNLRTLDSYGVLEEERGVFTFYSIITEDTILPFMKRLDAWSGRNIGKPITIIFNSPGGVVFDGLAFYDFMCELKRRGHKLTTKCIGAAMSMGAILLQAGDERVISSNAFFLIHEVQLFMDDHRGYSTTQLDDQRELQRKLQKRIVGQLAERSSLSVEEIEEKWKRQDWMMDAEEALKYGFVDVVDY